MNTAMKEEGGIQDTATFIQKVVNFWKIANVKKEGEDISSNDPFKGAIKDPEDQKLNYLLEFGDMCLKMISQPKKRVKQLTRDTALAIYQTCNGLVELARHLLSTTHVYVLFGKFSTDKLEKAYSKLRQGSGGTYFITAQQILEKLNILKANLLLRLTEMEDLPDDSGHKCDSCNYKMDEQAAEVFDNLPELENSLTLDTKNSLVYIAGYATRKDDELSEDEMLSVTTFYATKYGSFTDRLDRGQLNIPHDRACQWTFFCFIIFNSVKDKICRKSLSSIFSKVSDHFDFKMTEKHSRIISNIFIKNYCRETTPRSTKESSQKVLKLNPNN